MPGTGGLAELNCYSSSHIGEDKIERALNFVCPNELGYCDKLKDIRSQTSSKETIDA